MSDKNTSDMPNTDIKASAEDTQNNIQSAADSQNTQTALKPQDERIDRENQNSQAKQDGQKSEDKPNSESDREAPSKDCEDNLELHGLKFKARMKAKHERLKKNMEDMSGSQKTKYILYYYKWHMIALVVIVFCAISIPISIYKNSRPVAISYAIINCTDYSSLNEDVFDGYIDHYSLKKGYQVKSNNAVALDLDTYEEEYQKNPNSPNFTQFPMLCYNNFYDIIITDRAGLDYCSINALLNPIDSVLSADLSEALLSQSSDIFAEAPDYAGNSGLYAVDISDTDFAAKLNPGYEDVYLCFPSTSEQNLKNVRRILIYIFELDLEP